MKIFPFKAVYPKLERIPTDEAFFETVKEKYADYKAMGFFQTEDVEAFYIYQVDALQRSFIGLVACADIEDYLVGNIKKHETTIVKNEQIQLELLRQRTASIKPVLLTYPYSVSLTPLLKTYQAQTPLFYTITIGEEKHSFWRLSDPPAIAAIVRFFEEQMSVAYIADGHHRSATMALLYKAGLEGASKLLCAFFAPQELEIFAFHRVVQGLNGKEPDKILEELRALFVVRFLKKAAAPHRKLDMTFCLNGDWFYLQWRKSVMKEFEEGGDKTALDAQLLNEKILKPIFGVKNIRKDNRVIYVEGLKSPEELEKIALEHLPSAAFYLHAADFEDIFNIADSNGVTPPKSTFFEPRMKNGLLVYEI